MSRRAIQRRSVSASIGLARSAAAPALVAAALLGAGCSAPDASVPSLLVVERADYPRVFDAAIDTLTAVGMTTALRDREGGIIESEPRRAGNLLEPWRTDNDGIGQATENLVAPRRRRVRFEFTATTFDPPEGDPAAPLPGAEIAGPPGGAIATPLGDEGPLELRIWVYLEQASVPGLRSDPWSRALTTRTIETPPSPRRDARADPSAEGIEAQGVWTPVSRDEPYERRLMEALRGRLEQPPAVAPAAPAALTRSADRSSGTPRPRPG